MLRAAAAAGAVIPVPAATTAAPTAEPGPHNEDIARQFPAAQSPPPTDIGSLPQFWATFNNAHRRVTDGGWARQVTKADFPISETIAGVNMRLDSGSIRELHWHRASELAYVTNGNCRITIFDDQGRTDVSDVRAGDLWYFPAGFPHSLQGLGPNGCEFVICFDDGAAGEFDTQPATGWLAHTPPDVLAANFGVPAATFNPLPIDDRYIFQARLPGSLSADRDAVGETDRQPPQPFTFALASSTPVRESGSGAVRVADSRNFNISKTMAASLVTLAPGAMREMHWHPNADEWQYWIKGRGQMTVFSGGPKAVTQNFGPGDIGYVKQNDGHYVKNVGDDELEFLAVFRAPRYSDVSLSDWLTHTPPALVAKHLNIDEEEIRRFPRDKPLVMPQGPG